MKSIGFFVFIFCISLLSACSTYSTSNNLAANTQPVKAAPPPDYSARVPKYIAASQKTVVIYPNVHAWGAYNSSGELVRAGLATSGSNWCSDLGRPCRTKVGSFRIYSLGSPNCKSHIFPLPNGGAPMPYCMFFNGGQALHGSPASHVVDGNVSHGCVRLHIPDAEWLRYNFVEVGTRVIVKPYS